MTDSPDTGARSRFVINVIGLVGIVFGLIPIARYLLEFGFFGFTTAPYDWLALEGAARFIPPVLVLGVCILLAWVLEKRIERRS